MPSDLIRGWLSVFPKMLSTKNLERDHGSKKSDRALGLNISSAACCRRCPRWRTSARVSSQRADRRPICRTFQRQIYRQPTTGHRRGPAAVDRNFAHCQISSHGLRDCPIWKHGYWNHGSWNHGSWNHGSWNRGFSNPDSLIRAAARPATAAEPIRPCSPRSTCPWWVHRARVATGDCFSDGS